ncbi:MAG TPA: alcohol dehydrogenase catalytic domain-containing protein [Thermoanaerobaculia bacterium]|nr:alcohol dehydrogenase catalytic domain-containing protein [Thermoanaerobaculia bacterium]
MRAVSFEGIRRVAVSVLPDPEIEDPGDAVVAVRAAGVCGSDLHVYRGLEVGLDPGTAMGHEFAGEVVAVGSAVRGFRPGDRVASPFSTSCGDCPACRRGMTARCRRGRLFGWISGGRGLGGAQAELIRVPFADSTLVAMPEGLPFDLAVLAGDVIATGFFGAEQAGAAPGASIAVVGCGAVGLMAILGARELGAERIFALDAIPERLALAEIFGAEPISVAAPGSDSHNSADPALRINEATAGEGVDGVVEAVGSAESTRLAYAIVRAGGAIAALGVHNEPTFALTPGQLYDKNLTYRAGRCPVRIYLERLLRLADARRSEVARIISHRLPLAEGPRAYDLFDRRAEGCTKVVLSP